MRRNVVLSACNRATYLNQTQAIMYHKRLVKFYLCVRFITRLNTCVGVGTCACNCMPLLKRPDSGIHDLGRRMHAQVIHMHEIGCMHDVYANLFGIHEKTCTQIFNSSSPDQGASDN